MTSYLDQVLGFSSAFGADIDRCFLRRGFAAVELLDDLRVDPVKLFLGENAQEGPGEIQRLEDSTRLICPCG